MKIALITDQHFGVRQDSREFHDYFDKFYSEFFFPELRKRDIKEIIDLGDTFDKRQFINYLTLDRAKKMYFDVARNENIKIHSIIGNHTIFFKDTNVLNAMNMLFKDYDNMIVYDSPEEVVLHGKKVLFIPWINSSNRDDTFNLIQKTDANIVFGHLELAGFDMHSGVTIEHGDDPKGFKKFDAVYSGHFHHRQTKGNITYLGCPYEMTWADYGDPKGFHIFDTETEEIEFIETPFKIFKKIEYTGEDIDISDLTNSYVKIIVSDQSDPIKFEKFLAKASEQNPIKVQIIDNYQVTVEDDLEIEAEDTLHILDKYVDSMENIDDNQKKELSNLLRKLYNETVETTA